MVITYRVNTSSSGLIEPVACCFPRNGKENILFVGLLFAQSRTQHFLRIDDLLTGSALLVEAIASPGGSAILVEGITPLTVHQYYLKIQPYLMLHPLMHHYYR